MIDEPWDELMGPSDSQMKAILHGGGEQKRGEEDYLDEDDGPPRIARIPPASAFPNDRWANAEGEEVEKMSSQRSPAPRGAPGKGPSVTFASRHYDSEESSGEEDDESYLPTPLPSDDELFREALSYETDGIRILDKREDPGKIRQDALRMLQVADSQLNGSSYEVHRTITGGYQARNPSLPKKHIPAALSGISFTSKKSYSDYPKKESPPGIKSRDFMDQERYEYADDDAVQDLVYGRTTPRTLNEDEHSAKSWSSRYSVDRTMLSLSGGSSTPVTASSSTRKFLEKLDQKHARDRLSVSSIAANKSRSNAAAGLFGNDGFAYRQKHVFGKQNATLPAHLQPNLRTAWIDQDNASLPAEPPRKSWSEQVAQKRRCQRRFCFLIVGVLVILIVTMATMMGGNKNISATNEAQQSPDSAPEEPGNTAPSIATVHEAVTFYATSNVPYYDGDEVVLRSNLEALESDASFLIHLGSIQQVADTECASARYIQVADILHTSPIPVFIVPGKQDWPDCPDPDSAWDYWHENFIEYDQYWERDYVTTHQEGRKENFAFETGGVLFLGLHVVGGVIYSDEEIERRNGQNFEFVKGMVSDHATARVVVILANARPGLRQNAPFFSDLSKFLGDLNKPVLYIHAHSDVANLGEYQPFTSADNVIAFQVDEGGSHKPTKIVVDGSNEIQIME